MWWEEIAVSLAYFGATFFVWSAARRTTHVLLELLVGRVRQRKSGAGAQNVGSEVKLKTEAATARALLDEALAAFLLVAWSIEAYNQRTAFGHTAYGMALFLTGLVHYATNTDASPCGQLAKCVLYNYEYGVHDKLLILVLYFLHILLHEKSLNWCFRQYNLWRIKLFIEQVAKSLLLEKILPNSIFPID